MSELVDFMLEREKRILSEMAFKPEDQAIICHCGSARFYLLRDASAECAKCQQKQADVRWILT